MNKENEILLKFALRNVEHVNACNFNIMFCTKTQYIPNIHEKTSTECIFIELIQKNSYNAINNEQKQVESHTK